MYSSRPCRVSLPSPRSPVMTAVTPLSFSQRNRRRSSARRIASFVRPPNSASIVSRTMRFAPTEAIACSRRMNNPSRSYSPLSSISLRSMCTWSTASFFCWMSDGRSNPREATSPAISSPDSSNVISTPGSPNCSAPLMRKLMARSVLPDPAAPQMSVGRPAGKPPFVISSSPCYSGTRFGQARGRKRRWRIGHDSVGARSNR